MADHSSLFKFYGAQNVARQKLTPRERTSMSASRSSLMFAKPVYINAVQQNRLTMGSLRLNLGRYISCLF